MSRKLTATLEALKTPPTLFRSGIARGIAATGGGAGVGVEREGGDQRAGVIRGLAVITRGEAIGHKEWIDSEFLRQTAEAINESPPGIKARFTHPGLTGDGMGKFLGRVKNARLDGDVVRADLHFSPSAHKTPDGDLADYVMGLAENDPKAFGTSIAHTSDRKAEQNHTRQHLDSSGRFTSPDPQNRDNFVHIRLGVLKAIDTVDQPAANPGGLFGVGQEITIEADALLSYALGITDTTPPLGKFGIDPDRARGFVRRFLKQHDINIPIKSEADALREEVEAHLTDYNDGSTESAEKKEKNMTGKATVGRDLTQDIIPPPADGVLLGLGVQLDLNDRDREEAQQFKQVKLHDLARIALERAYRKAPRNADELFAAAVSTGTFANVLTTTARRMLAKGYQSYEGTFRQWATSRPVAGFRTHQDIRISEFAAFDKIGDAGELAQTKLKPGGLCLTYSGKMFLPIVLNRMMKHLDWWWLFAIRLTGGHLQVWSRKLWNDWKPVIVMAKRSAGPPQEEWMMDFIEGGGRDRRFHRWGQDAAEATYWIENLTEPGALVVDPFCGGGAIPVACKATGRRWLATEIDEGAAAVARKRIMDG